MKQRNFPEWSAEQAEYVEPTQVVRSFGYDVFANPVSDEAMQYNNDTFGCVLKVEGEIAQNKNAYENEDAASSDIKTMAEKFGAARAGITLVDQKYVYKGHDVPHRYAILMAVPMDYDEIKFGATERHVKEVLKIYAEAGHTAANLAEYIRDKGYPARAHSLRFEQLMMLPHAIAAGLGELGRHGSLINRELGCSFRLACVTTDLPLKMDSAIDEGIDDVCVTCNVCTDHCPGDAISGEKQTVRDETRWLVDTELCAPYWGSYYSCGICLEVCPFNAKALDGKYKKSFVERIKQIDIAERKADLKSGLQQTWQFVEKPEEKEAGWRNRVKGKGDTAILVGGVPMDGLPDEVYNMRELMGMEKIS
ncbi:MAG: 4Fe-4S dicluster domain-containing protein [Gammaproteobacteria bacterium]|nr:4Fe-4S dicluster domain-containing protein [Gammaproteobacteria bacterium]